MKTEFFNYHLPPDLIAQIPLPERDQSRLMVISKSDQSISHHQFADITQFLKPGDILVLNNTKVIKARLFARRASGANVEVFLLEPEGAYWKVLFRPAKRVRVGEILTISDEFSCRVVSKDPNLVELLSAKPVEEMVETYGHVPLPPYIKSEAVGYQTVFAEKPGAVAAPTAGLHFTPRLLTIIGDMGVQIETITLHVGLGTFQPIVAEDIADHVMHSERYEIDAETASRLNARKGRIVCVGSTALRTMESAFENGRIRSGTGVTQLFITPGYRFKVADALVTNFHLPKTSLMVLVSAFAGADLIQRAYREAIDQKYRFYSFGDAMLILP